jgi:hypothetical protein
MYKKIVQFISWHDCLNISSMLQYLTWAFIGKNQYNKYIISVLSSVQQTGLIAVLYLCSELLSVAFVYGSSQHKMKYCCQLLYHAANCCVDCEVTSSTSHTRNRSSIKVFLAILCLPATLRTITSICRQKQNKIHFSRTETNKCCIIPRVSVSDTAKQLDNTTTGHRLLYKWPVASSF